jgi:hypothetical protein
MFSQVQGPQSGLYTGAALDTSAIVLVMGPSREHRQTDGMVSSTLHYSTVLVLGTSIGIKNLYSDTVSHMSNLIPHTSYLISYTSYLIPHTSYLIPRTLYLHW